MPRIGKPSTLTGVSANVNPLRYFSGPLGSEDDRDGRRQHSSTYA
jgi:hypothetical protein